MPSPERPTGDQHKEGEPSSYFQARRFTNEQTAYGVYTVLQDTIFQHECDLSTYRFLLERISHVAVLGSPPPAKLDEQIQTLLTAGEPAILPLEVRTLLEERRAQAAKIGSWVEGHYRPGRPLKGPPARE